MKRLIGVVVVALALVLAATPAQAKTTVEGITVRQCDDLENTKANCQVGVTVPLLMTTDGNTFVLLDAKGKVVKTYAYVRPYEAQSVVMLFPIKPATLAPGSYTVKVQDKERAHWECSIYDKDQCSWIKAHTGKAKYFAFNYDGTKVSN